MISIEQDFNKLKISFFDNKGDNRVLSADIPQSQMFNWVVASDIDGEERQPVNPNYLSQYGKQICKKKTTRLNRYRIREILNSFPDSHKEMVFSNHKPRKFYADIETDIVPGQGFPDANKAREAILSYAYCDEHCNGVVSGLIPLSEHAQKRLQDRVNDYFKKTGKTFNIKFKHYENETLMLKEFVQHEIPKMPWLTGWNFLKFDWKYIIKRCENLGIDYSYTSPTRKMDRYTFKEKFNKKNKWEVLLPKHRSIIDYQMVYERWDTVVKFKENSSLDAVSKQLLGYEKVKYPGSLKDFYENDYEGYLFYNMVDTILVYLIDERILAFNTMLAISNDARIPLMDAVYTSMSVEAKMQDQFEKKGIKLIPRGKTVQTDDEDSYSGGWVYEPEVGLKEYMFIFDFASQFPSLMSAFNMGTDTYIGKKVFRETIKVVDGKEVKEREWTGEVYDLEGKPMTIDPVNHITTAYGTVFDKTKSSTLRLYIAGMINQRLEAKKNSAELETEILNLKELLNSL